MGEWGHGVKPVCSVTLMVTTITSVTGNMGKLLLFILPISTTLFQKTIAHGIVLHAPFGKQVSVSGKDYLCVAELCVSEL